jgi:hypothetical protein
MAGHVAVGHPDDAMSDIIVIVPIGSLNIRQSCVSLPFGAAPVTALGMLESITSPLPCCASCALHANSRNVTRKRDAVAQRGRRPEHGRDRARIAGRGGRVARGSVQRKDRGGAARRLLNRSS